MWQLPWASLGLGILFLRLFLTFTCEMQLDGEAEVSNFFNTTICQTEHTSAEDSETLTAVFRGRPLKGIEITLPAGYSGTYIKEPKSEDQKMKTDV
ncbi:hypothetical protein Btru_003072 [Bulinus truncatus]|nr:hypothetical protein Btru_003072 [Bulinus truncatus]